MNQMTTRDHILEPDPTDLTGPVGAHHYARFFDNGPRLLVHFATAPKGMKSDQHFSALEVQARKREWSLLLLVAEAGHDFRTADVVEFFDHCSDEATFDLFEDVLFYGDGDGGYAALCYALSAPGARIVAVTPSQPAKATTERYVPEAQNLAVAQRLVWLHDPYAPRALDPSPVAQVLTTRYLKPGAEARLIRRGAFWPLLDGVMGKGVDSVSLFAALRARRNDRTYIRRLTKKCLNAGQFARAAAVAGSFAKRSGRKRFARTYASIVETYDLKGFDPIEPPDTF